MMRRNFLLAAALASLCSSPSPAREPKPYPLDVDAGAPQAVVRMQRGFGDPALFLVDFDGKDPRSFPSMAAYAERVREAESKLQPGKFSLLPGRNEPEAVAVSPGSHAYGVLFMFTGTAWGLLGNGGIRGLAEKYPPKEPVSPNEKFATAKHYERLEFTVRAGQRYLVSYSWDKDAEVITLSVGECSDGWDDCKVIPFKSSHAQTSTHRGLSPEEPDDPGNEPPQAIGSQKEAKMGDVPHQFIVETPSR